MNLAEHITSVPRAFDRERGAEHRALYPDAPSRFQDLVEGVAGCSGYLAGLLRSEADWLTARLTTPVAGIVDECCAEMDGQDFSGLGKALRLAKRRAALVIALADIGGLFDLDAVTGSLSRLADTALQRAVEFLIGVEQARGKLPECTAPLGGLVVFSMGKLGGRELNYSSDIDLVVFYDETAYSEADQTQARAVLIAITRRLIRLLSDVTDEGYVFRTDLRLRPDPAVTPVCTSLAAAENYYEAQGRNWERAAWIKARVSAGDHDAGARFLETLQPFIWRRHLDYAALQDVHDLRLKIRSHKGLGGALSLPGHDVKLGRGGIREIEFFTQTRQLICGGRDRDLRSSRTCEALDALTDKGWVKPQTAETLKAAYADHRKVEHRLQMFEDAQTHSLPKSQEGFDRLAAFLGYEDTPSLKADLQARFDRVEALAEAFFTNGEGGENTAASSWEGFDNPERAAGIAAGWKDLPSFRSERAQSIFGRIEPQIATCLARAQSPDEALVQFDSFLKGLPAGVQVFSLFAANPQLLDLLADICATAPRLARYLGRNAGVMDAVLMQDFFQPLPGVPQLQEDLTGQLARAADYEAGLDVLRIWVKEQKFRVGVHLLRGLSKPSEAATAHSDVAEASLRVLLPFVREAFAVRHGAVPGDGMAVIGMGKLGSAELTATSDLDLIMVYDAPLDAVSDGSKQLAATTYYARLTQMFVSALTSPTSQGVLYETDMRLRPSGRKGPVAVSLNGFRNYQRDEAWTWEHLALTRARVVAGSETVGAATDAAIAETLALPRDPEKVLGDVVDMRVRIAAATGAVDLWDVKGGPGGMLDIDLLLQAGTLILGLTKTRAPRAMLDALGDAGWLGRDEVDALAQTLDLLRRLQQIGRLAREDGFHPDKAGRGLTELVLRVCGFETIDALASALEEGRSRTDEIITGRLTA